MSTCRAIGSMSYWVKAALVASVALVGCADGAGTGGDGLSLSGGGGSGSGAISMSQAITYAKAAGVACGNDLAIAGAIAMAESSLEPGQTASNGPTSGCPSGSVDRGLWQINSCYHADVSDSCAFDPACNAKAMASISSNGTNWSPWSTYKSGAYTKFMSESGAAEMMVCGDAGAGDAGGGGSSGSGGGGSSGSGGGGSPGGGSGSGSDGSGSGGGGSGGSGGSGSGGGGSAGSGSGGGGSGGSGSGGGGSAGSGSGGGGSAGSGHGGGGGGSGGTSGKGGYAFVMPHEGDRHHAVELNPGDSRTFEFAWRDASGLSPAADLRVETAGHPVLQVASVGARPFARAGYDVAQLEEGTTYRVALTRAGDTVTVSLLDPSGHAMVRTTTEVSAAQAASADVVLPGSVWREAIVSDSL